MSVSSAVSHAKGNHHYCDFVLIGGASQFDVPVVICCSSPYPVSGHVISQVHTHTQTLNLHHFTFSFYLSLTA